jgi:hypothetical protein
MFGNPEKEELTDAGFMPYWEYRTYTSYSTSKKIYMKNLKVSKIMWFACFERFLAKEHCIAQLVEQGAWKATCPFTSQCVQGSV